MDETKLRNLIIGRMEELALSKRQLFEKMGRRNLNKASRHFHNLFEFHAGFSSFIEDLCEALELPLSSVQDILNEYAEEERQKEIEYERSIFRPHIVCMCRNALPSPIFAGGAAFHRRFVYLDEEFMSADWETQKKLAKELILKHFQEENGAIIAFGPIIHYVMRLEYGLGLDFYHIFDIQGNYIENPSPDLQRNPGQPMGISLR
jgi:hypothetical protein